MNTESPKMKHRISFDEETDETYFSPILVGVSGGSASGKTTLCYHISKSLSGCVIFSLDNYYKVILWN
jgi:uridine kinase